MSAQANTEAEPTLVRLDPQAALTAIRTENRRAGLTVSDTDEFVMAHNLTNALRHDPTTGRTYVIDDAGNARHTIRDGEKADLSAADFIRELQATATRTPRTRSSPVPVTAGANATARAMAQNAASRFPRSAAKAAQAAALHAEYGNPWSFRSTNRTRQSVIQNLDPALADQLRSTAGH